MQQQSLDALAVSPFNSPILILQRDSRHEFIHRFQHRTALSLGSADTAKFYAAGIPQLAMEHPYLMHTISALTLLHDRALSGSPHTTTVEAYHLGTAAALFNERLSLINLKQNRDAVWSTAVYLCTASIFNVEARDPQHTWPLAKPSVHDLEWLKFQNGLRTLWALASSMEDSVGVFTNLDRQVEINCVQPATPGMGIEGIPQKLVRLYNLDQSSTSENSPYHGAVRYLSDLLHVEGSQTNILKFMVFAGGVTQRFRTLLQQKDPRALLLLGLWYCKLLRSSWWMIPRANVECHGICIYLKRLEIKEEDFLTVLNTLCEAFFASDFDLVTALAQDDERPPTFRPNMSGPVPDEPTSVSVDMFWME